MTTPTPGLTPEQIARLQLGSGAHKPGDPDPCLLEAESIFAGEPFGDSPSCVDPVLAAFGRSWNDALADADRQTLKQYLGRLAGTNNGPALSAKRSFMALDWLWRVHAPLWLDQVPELAEHAAALRALAPITAELGVAERAAALEQAARAARDAWDAAASAAATAAYEAASCATYEEAREKADAVFMKHRDAVQESLHRLFTDMINAKLDDASEKGAGQ